MYTAVPARAFWRAAWAHTGTGAPPHTVPTALTEATRRLAVVYPGREITLTDSGTSALMLALRHTRPGNDRPPCVALPAYACPDIGTAAIGAGYRIALYDVEPDSLEPDLASLRRCLQAGASHVVAVHLFGRLVNVGRVEQEAAHFGAVVIEDAAQHAGGSRHGVRGGALAEWSILSFGRGKGLNAGGGGALLRRCATASAAPSLQLPSMATSLGVLAKAAVAELLSAPWIYWLPQSIPALQLGETVYHAPSPPRSSTVASASLLVETLQQEPAALALRRQHEQRYREALDHRTGVALRAPDAGSLSGALRFPVRVHAEVGRALGALGVVRAYPRILSEYVELAAHIEVMPHALRGAAELAETLHTLPTHARVRPDDIARLVQQVAGSR